MATITTSAAAAAAYVFPGIAGGADYGGWTADILNLWPVITSANATSAGYAQKTAGGVFDAVKGYQPNGSSLYNNTAPTPPLPITHFSIAMEIERSALSLDNSWNSSSFYDSYGDVNRTSETEIFSMANGSGDQIFFAITAQDGGFFVYYESGGTFHACPGNIFVSSHAPPGSDPTYAQVVLNVSGASVQIFVDGLPITSFTMFSGPFVSPTQRIVYIGGKFDGTNNVGAHFIRSFRMSSQNVFVPITGPKIGMFGDSFVQLGTDAANITTDTVAYINDRNLVVQTGGTTPLGQSGNNCQSLTAIANDVTNNNNQGHAFTWVTDLNMYMLRAFGFMSPWFNAAKNGHGWTGSNYVLNNIGSPATHFNTFPKAYWDAMNAWLPEVVMAWGCPNNDIQPYGTGFQSIYANTTFQADIQAGLDYMVDNNPKLKTIIFVEGFPWNPSINFGSFNGVGNPAWLTEYFRLLNILRSNISTYSPGSGARATKYPKLNLPNKVSLIYAKSDELWRLNPNYARFAVNTNPDNTTPTKYNGASENPHPCAEGFLQCAAIIWPYLQTYLKTYRASR